MSNHQPQRLDKVWVGKRQTEGKQPNGYIIAVIKEHRGDMWPEELIVKHFENDKYPPETVSYSWGEFEGNYTGETQGWVLEEQ